MNKVLSAAANKQPIDGGHHFGMNLAKALELPQVKILRLKLKKFSDIAEAIKPESHSNVAVQSLSQIGEIFGKFFSHYNSCCTNINYVILVEYSYLLTDTEHKHMALPIFILFSLSPIMGLCGKHHFAVGHQKHSQLFSGHGKDGS